MLPEKEKMVERAELDTRWTKLKEDVQRHSRDVSYLISGGDAKAPVLIEENKTLMSRRKALIELEKALLNDTVKQSKGNDTAIENARQVYSDNRHRDMKTKLKAELVAISPTARENVQLFLGKAQKAVTTSVRSVAASEGWRGVKKAAGSCIEGIQAFARKAARAGKIFGIALAVIVFSIPTAVITGAAVGAVQLATAAVDKRKAYVAVNKKTSIGGHYSVDAAEKAMADLREKKYQDLRGNRDVTLGNVTAKMKEQLEKRGLLGKTSAHEERSVDEEKKPRGPGSS